MTLKYAAARCVVGDRGEDPAGTIQNLLTLYVGEKGADVAELQQGLRLSGANGLGYAVLAHRDAVRAADDAKDFVAYEPGRDGDLKFYETCGNLRRRLSRFGIEHGSSM